MKSKVNFHIHTVHSDGGKTVEQIVKELNEQGVKHFAITDHDTVDGVEEAMCLADEYGMHCVSGVEISAVFSNGMFGADVDGLDETCIGHIVALDFDVRRMREMLQRYQLNKEEKIIMLTYSLLRAGFPICKENILSGELSGRTVVAKELVRAGCATDVNDAFERILNSREFVRYASVYPYINNVIHDIRNCGGLSVIAHPFGYTRGGKKELSKKQVAQYIKRFQHADAVEVYYRQYDCDKIAYIEELAEKYGLMKSIGTDYHHSPINLVKYPEYAAKLKKETLCFDVDGVTADESILNVIDGRKDTRDRSFELENNKYGNTSYFVGAHVRRMHLEFEHIITESLSDGGVDQSEATYKIKNSEVEKFLNAIGCSVYDDDEKIGSALKRAYEAVERYGKRIENMLRDNGVSNIDYFIYRSED